MKCDLHVHTFHSPDSANSPEKLIEKAMQMGINCIAITDHGQVTGAVEVQNFARKNSILIIPSIEIKSREGDILGLNVKSIIPNGLSAKETIKKIKEDGGFVVIPHPFGFHASFKENLEELVSDIDAIEVLNVSILGNGNKRAFAFAKKHDIPFTVGSDSHFLGFLGRAYLEIVGEDLSITEVLEAIKNKNCEARGREATFYAKIIDRVKRNLVRIKNDNFSKVN